jgi:hypothetical protein
VGAAPVLVVVTDLLLLLSRVLSARVVVEVLALQHTVVMVVVQISAIYGGTINEFRFSSNFVMF